MSSSIIPGKPNVKQHRDILDIIADHSLTQIVDKPTRNDKTLDLIITNYHSIVDNLETIPPIGEADHDILSLEITVSLRRCKHKPRQVLKYSKANWNNIKQDLKTTYHKINQSQDSQDIDSMWNLFKDSLQKSISKNIPTKTIKYDNKLPWISDELRKKMNKYRRKLRNIISVGCFTIKPAVTIVAPSRHRYSYHRCVDCWEKAVQNTEGKYCCVQHPEKETEEIYRLRVLLRQGDLNMWVTAFDEVAEEIVGITVKKFSAFDDDGRKRFVRGVSAMKCYMTIEKSQGVYTNYTVDSMKPAGYSY